MRKIFSAVFFTAIAGSLCFAQTQQPRPMPRGDATLRLLEQRIPEVSFDQAPFEQVMDWVTEFTQANVIIRWQTITDAGVSRDQPISIKVRNVRLSQILWMVINEAGSQGVRLAYRASGNMIIVSTEEDLNKEMIVKVYDVSDLLVSAPRFTNASTLDPGQALQSIGQGGGGGGGGQGLFGEGTGNDDEGGEENEGTDIQTLVQLITDTVEPDSWVQNGGVGTIQPFRTMLVVRNTILVHQRLGGYIEDVE